MKPHLENGKFYFNYSCFQLTLTMALFNITSLTNSFMEIKLISWNVNGIRSVIKKDFLETVKILNPDILCLQETKAQKVEVEQVLELLPGYAQHINAAKTRKGYSGTAILVKEAKPEVSYDIGIEEHDQEGRVVTLEYPDFFLVNVYVPNSGRGLVRLDYRQGWDKHFLQYLKTLEELKPVIACGDFNVAHQPIDLANPKSNYNKTAGYTQVEIDGFSKFLKEGFVDTFRHFHPDKIAYTYWSYMFNARKKNVGWRIDYFLVSQDLLPKVQSSYILPEFHGSDHCPVGLEIELN